MGSPSRRSLKIAHSQRYSPGRRRDGSHRIPARLLLNPPVPGILTAQGLNFAHLCRRRVFPRERDGGDGPAKERTKTRPPATAKKVQFKKPLFWLVAKETPDTQIINAIRFLIAPMVCIETHMN